MKVRNFVGLLSERLLLDASLRRGLYVLEQFQINHLNNYQKIGGYYIYCHVDNCQITILGPIPLRCVVVVVVFFRQHHRGWASGLGMRRELTQLSHLHQLGHLFGFRLFSGSVWSHVDIILLHERSFLCHISYVKLIFGIKLISF